MRQYLIKLCFLLLPFFSNTGHAYCLPWLLDNQPDGFYLSAFGGVNGGYDFECENVKTNRGYYCGMNVGKKIFPNIRLEGDFTWQRNHVNSIILEANPLDHPRGAFNIESVMANAIFDLNFPFPGSPSIGAGIGYAYAHGHWSGNLTQNNGNLFIEKHYKGSYKKDGFAWQIIADLNFFICDDLKINIEYRFFKLNDKLNNYKFGLALAKFF